MMEQLQVWVLAISAAAVIAIILFILIITLFVKLGKMKKRYAALLNGEHNVNMEELIIGIQAKLNELGEQGGNLTRQVAAIQQTLKTMQSKIGIHRYSAFGESGGNDLSFTVAMLNELADGVVLTGIYGRDQTYIYAKPIQKGVSAYTLSPEEKEAITKALQLR